MTPQAIVCVTLLLFSSLELLAFIALCLFPCKKAVMGAEVGGRRQRCMLEDEMLSRGISSVSTKYLQWNPLFCMESSLRWTKAVFFQIWSPLDDEHFPNWASV